MQLVTCNMRYGLSQGFGESIQLVINVYVGALIWGMPVSGSNRSVQGHHAGAL